MLENEVELFQEYLEKQKGEMTYDEAISMWGKPSEIAYGDRGYNYPTNKDKYEGRPAFGDAQWMAKLSFLYQLPWGFSISLFAHAKQGYTQSRQIMVWTPERAAVGWLLLISLTSIMSCTGI